MGWPPHGKAAGETEMADVLIQIHAVGREQMIDRVKKSGCEKQARHVVE